MTDDPLKKLFDALDDETAAALLGSLSVPQETAARIAARVEEKRIAAQMPAASPRRVLMRRVFPAAACIAVLLTAAAAFRLGRRAPLDPVFSSETSAAVPEETTALAGGEPTEPTQEPALPLSTQTNAAGSLETHTTVTGSSAESSTVTTTARTERTAPQTSLSPTRTTPFASVGTFSGGTTTVCSVASTPSAVSTPHFPVTTPAVVASTSHFPVTTPAFSLVTTPPDPWWLNTTAETTTTRPEAPA